MKFYPLADTLSLKEKAFFELDKLPPYKALSESRKSIMAVNTGQFRPPKAGEWYLSGAIPAAYKIKHDGCTTSYYIAKLVKVKTITRVTKRLVKINDEISLD